MSTSKLKPTVGEHAQVEGLGDISIRRDQKRRVLVVRLTVAGRLLSLRALQKSNSMKVNSIGTVREGDGWKLKLKILGALEVLQELARLAKDSKRRVIVSGAVYRKYLKDRDDIESGWNKLLIDPLCREPMRVFTDDAMSNIDQERITLGKPTPALMNGRECVVITFEIERWREIA